MKGYRRLLKPRGVLAGRNDDDILSHANDLFRLIQFDDDIIFRRCDSVADVRSAVIVGDEGIVIGTSVLHMSVNEMMPDARVIAEVIYDAVFFSYGTKERMPDQAIDQVALENGSLGHFYPLAVGNHFGIGKELVRGLVELVSLEIIDIAEKRFTSKLIRRIVPAQDHFSVSGRGPQGRHFGWLSEAIVRFVNDLGNLFQLEEIWGFMSRRIQGRQVFIGMKKTLRNSLGTSSI